MNFVRCLEPRHDGKLIEMEVVEKNEIDESVMSTKETSIRAEVV